MTMDQIRTSWTNIVFMRNLTSPKEVCSKVVKKDTNSKSSLKVIWPRTKMNKTTFLTQKKINKNIIKLTTLAEKNKIRKISNRIHITKLTLIEWLKELYHTNWAYKMSQINILREHKKMSQFKCLHLLSFHQLSWRWRVLSRQVKTRNFHCNAFWN